MEKSELEGVRSELGELKGLVLKLLSREGERPRNYSYEDAAKLLGLKSSKTVSRMVASGELMPIQLRGKRLIPIEEIDRVSTPRRMESSGATEEQIRFDGAAAMRRLKELRAKRKR